MAQTIVGSDPQKVSMTLNDDVLREIWNSNTMIARNEKNKIGQTIQDKAAKPFEKNWKHKNRANFLELYPLRFSATSDTTLLDVNLDTNILFPGHDFHHFNL